MLLSAPICSCGGHFTFWANVKCPKCRYEFPWARPDEDKLDVRIHANRIVIIDGAIVYDDKPEDTWLERVEAE
jgi:hypothetical protein